MFVTTLDGLALDARTVVYTPRVHNTPRIVDREVRFLQDRLSWAIEHTLHPDQHAGEIVKPPGTFADLLIVDEADRLKTASLEQLRDHNDRTGVGLILIGMPGIERRLARYPPTPASSKSTRSPRSAAKSSKPPGRPSIIGNA